MSPQATAAICRLNLDFYNQTARYWNHDLHYVWEGWDRLLSDWWKLDPQNILDIGCGNARLAEFFRQEFFLKDRCYTGLENSDFYLQQAQAAFHTEWANFRLLSADILDSNWPQSLSLDTDPSLSRTQFDLVCMFGVLHHIPGADNRHRLLDQVRSLLADQGRLVLTTWRFLDIPRLAKRVMSLSKQAKVLAEYGLTIADLEEGDYILDWVKGRVSYRFAHYYTLREITDLLTLSGFVIEDHFLADGPGSDRNCYLICRLNRSYSSK